LTIRFGPCSGCPATSSGRLEHAIEQEGEAGEELWADLQRRALARALLNTDVAELDRQERDSEQLLSFRDPARPDDPKAVHYVTYHRDLVAPDRWYMDNSYRDQHPELPATLTTVELQLHEPRPWRPGVAAGEVSPCASVGDERGHAS
jgi:hypothetical protein